MLLLVTVVACWIGYEVNWIRQRHAASADWTATEGFGPPGLLWLFGEKGYSDLERMTFDRSLTAVEEAELKRVKQLFPEANVTWSTVPFTRGDFHGY